MSSTLCDTCDKDSRYMAAKAENEKLREERDMYRDLVGMMDHPDLNVQLQAENAELRGLARHLYTCLSFCDREDEERGCGFCPYRSASENCEFEQRLIELGVEVDA